MRALKTDITLTVGSGGNFSTINDALENLSQNYPAYTPGGYTAEIQLLTGFVMAEQIIAKDINLSFITITSVDAEVTIQRSALTDNIAGVYGAFMADNAVLPVMGALFNMDTSGDGTTRDGVFIQNNSVAYIKSACGVKNAAKDGMYALSNSYIQAASAVFTGAGDRGILAGGGSSINAVSANAGSAGTTGIQVFNGSHIAANSATGTLSQTANTPTANGIIHQ